MHPGGKDLRGGQSPLAPYLRLAVAGWSGKWDHGSADSLTLPFALLMEMLEKVSH